MKSISIAAPVFNEELNIENCVKVWIDVLTELKIKDYEIILCDDKSTDNSKKVIQELSQNNEKIKLVCHDKNQGAAKAVITAGNQASMERILFVDSDGQFPRNSIRDIILKSNQYENSVIFGARQVKEDSSLTQVGTKLTTILFNLIYNKDFNDISCILKVFPTKIYKKIKLESTGLNVSTEMSCRALEANIDIKETFVSHKAREFGTSSAAGTRFIKHGLKRIIILKYFLIRKLLTKFGVISRSDI